MRQPANVSTPATAGCGLVVQVRIAPPGVVIARVIEVVAVVTVLPPASWTVTVGWLVQAVLLAPPPGCAVKASLLAAPKPRVTVAGELVAVQDCQTAVTV